MSFRDFVLRGNVMDLAVGVIIGAAFGKIVDSLVSDLIRPVIASIIGKPDFSEIFVKLGSVPATFQGVQNYANLKAAGVPMLGVGSFFTVLLNFLILAFVIYQLVKVTQGIAAKYAPPAPPPGDDILLLREIRDSLKK